MSRAQISSCAAASGDVDSMVASTDLLVNFVYIVSMGLDDETQSQWASSAASGAASRMHHEKVMRERIAFWLALF